MKNECSISHLLSRRGVLLMAIFFCLFTYSQEVVIDKSIVTNAANCNQFDVTLSITGNPITQPQEVVLLIDNSGSMADIVSVNGQSKTIMEVVKDAAIDFVDEFFLPANDPNGENRLAIVSYNSFANTEINLNSGTSKQLIINEINSLTPGGSTNMEDALIEANQVLSPPSPQGTFDCRTSRNIILFTDGVALWHNGLGSNVTASGQCSDTTINTACQTRAFTAATNAETIVVDGITYNQNIFTVGFTGSLTNQQEVVSRHTLDNIQNNGAFYTDSAADLSGIYNQILNQLLSAATALSGESLVKNTIPNLFQIVEGSISTSKGDFAVDGQEIEWLVDKVGKETITLNYSIQANAQSCGLIEGGTSVMKYENSQCNIVTETFENKDICVPCPEATINLNRSGCNSIDFQGTINQNTCLPTGENYSWKFFLDGQQIGTSNLASGTYIHPNTTSFEGEFKAELTYNGEYQSGCPEPEVVEEKTLQLTVLKVNQNTTLVSCTGGADGTIDITVSGGIAPYTYLWNDGVTSEDRSSLAAGTYTVTVKDASNCEVQETMQIGTVPNEAPEINCPSDINQNVDSGVCGATVIYSMPTFTDNCPNATINQIAGLESNSVFPLGITTNTFEVTDADGLKTTCSFTVTITDNQAPITPIIARESFLCSGTPKTPTTTDACSSTSIEGTTTTTFPITEIGTTEVIWTFTDSAGNTTTANQEVVIEGCSDLSLIKLVNRAILKIGDTVRYRIKLTNKGPHEAIGVKVTDVLSNKLTYVPATSTIPNNTTYDGNTWDLTAITIAKDQVIILEIDAIVNQAGTIVNTAQVQESTHLDLDSTPGQEVIIR